MARSGHAGSSGELPAPVAQRLRRPSWRDPRLAVGLVLVLGSIIVGGRVVAAADDTEAVYATTTAVTAGDVLGEDQLQVVRAKLPAGAANYLMADRPIPEGAVALQPMAAGELVPLAAVGESGSVPVQPVAVPVSGQLPSSIRKSSYVDVWVAEVDPNRSQHYLAPTLLVASVQVAEVQQGSSSLGASSAQTVQVLLGPRDVPKLLTARNNQAAISLLPAAAPAAEPAGGDASSTTSDTSTSDAGDTGPSATPDGSATSPAADTGETSTP